MLEAFSPCCEKEMLLMECRLEGMDFRSKGSSVVSRDGAASLAGKRTGRMTSRKPTRVRPCLPKGYGPGFRPRTGPEEDHAPTALYRSHAAGGHGNLRQGDSRRAGTGGREGAGNRNARHESRHHYHPVQARLHRRSGKSIVPTEKGLHIYEAVKEMLVADVSLTGSWGKGPAADRAAHAHDRGFHGFHHGLHTQGHPRNPEPQPSGSDRPHVHLSQMQDGHIIVREKIARCDNKGCGLTVYRRFLNKELTDQHLEQLFSSGSTRLIKGFKGKKGVAFDASVTFDASFTLTLSFPKNGKKKK